VNHEANCSSRSLARILKLDHQDEADTISTTPSGEPSIIPWATSPRHCCAGGIDGSLEDGQGLPDDTQAYLSPSFAIPEDRQVSAMAGCLLAANVISLFRVDLGVGDARLVAASSIGSAQKPKLRAAWEGFLWSPRLYRPLMEVLKPAFLDTARHYAAIGKHEGQYASLLTFTRTRSR
jgi:hypothetical protein